MKKEVMKNNKGFSLVELIVVIAIMAVLMAVLAPALLRYVEKSRKQSDASAASEIVNAVEIALSDDEIYDEVNGTDTITVKYKGEDGSLTQEGITDTTAANDFMTEIATTLKAEGDATTGFTIDTAKSKTYKTDTFIVKAEYDSNKSAYIVEGDWETNPSN
jgi:prepilin-type N-terminal cleavage/methylation domain-containing protein